MDDRVTSLDADSAGQLCRLLSRLFIRQPDEALLAFCRDGSGLLADCAGDPAFAPAVERLTAAARMADVVLLGRAWTLLFSGAGGPATVAPYASVLQEGRMFGSATARMDALLTELDLAVGADCREPADHIAIQLDVLAALLERRAFPAAESFRRSELGWVQTFCCRCASGDPTEFYAGAAQLLAALVETRID